MTKQELVYPKRAYDQFKNQIIFSRIEDVPHTTDNLKKTGQYVYGGVLVNSFLTIDEQECFMVKKPA